MAALAQPLRPRAPPVLSGVTLPIPRKACRRRSPASPAPSGLRLRPLARAQDRPTGPSGPAGPADHAGRMGREVLAASTAGGPCPRRDKRRSLSSSGCRSPPRSAPAGTTGAGGFGALARLGRQNVGRGRAGSRGSAATPALTPPTVKIPARRTLLLLSVTATAGMPAAATRFGRSFTEPPPRGAIFRMGAQVD